MAFFGASPEGLRSLATDADAMLAVVTDARALLTDVVGVAPTIWFGADADAFVATVSGTHIPSLQATIGRLEQAIVELRTSADAQERTSG